MHCQQTEIHSQLQVISAQSPTKIPMGICSSMLAVCALAVWCSDGFERKHE